MTSGAGGPNDNPRHAEDGSARACLEARSTPDPAASKPRRLTPARLCIAAATLAGVLLAVGVVAWTGFGQVLSALTAIGWPGFGLLVLYSLAVFVVTGGAWGVLAREAGARSLSNYVFGRMLRESASDMLPFSALGGVVIGARGAVLLGSRPAQVYGSLAVDLVTEIVAQVLFLLLGLALLSARLSGQAGGGVFLLAFAAAIALAVVLIVGMVVAQRRGFSLLDRLAVRFAPAAAGGVQGMKAAVTAIYRRPARLAASVGLHTLGWLATALASWIVLHLMGVNLSPTAVVTIEALLSAVKSAAFVVPNGVGVQEAAYVLLGHLFGLPADTAVALSLLKRAKDIVIGAPMLLAWQALEGRRITRNADPGRQAA